MTGLARIQSPPRLDPTPFGLSTRPRPAPKLPPYMGTSIAAWSRWLGWFGIGLLAAAAGARAGVQPSLSEPFTCGVHSHRSLHAFARNDSIDPIGTRRLLYILVKYANDDRELPTFDQAQRDLEESNALLQSISFGQFKLEWTITPLLTLATTRDDYTDPAGFDRLLDDARAAARAAGYSFEEYELDVVRHTGVPTLQGGNANLGRRGAQVQAPGAVLLTHELGHNLGLLHANSWETGGAGLSAGSPPLPSNWPSLPEPRTIPTPEATLSRESIDGPGQSAEYGDRWDIMGSGSLQFGAANKRLLRWLGENGVVTPATSGVYRIYTPEAPAAQPDRSYALRLPGGQHDLWVELAPSEPVDANPNGLLIRWAQLGPEFSATLIRDTNPGSFAVSTDAKLDLGRTFSDRLAGLHITPVATGGEKENRWVDVRLHFGTPLSNQSPSLQITVPDTAEVGQPVTLRATASDPDGDALSWHWRLGDGTSSPAPDSVEKVWSEPGDIVVQCEVTDARGGVARANRVIRVGAPRTGRIRGRVLDPAGNGVPDVLVYNGRTAREYRSTRTDSEGRYILIEPAGEYQPLAFRFGWVSDPSTKVALPAEGEVTLDLTATPLPAVDVTAPATVAESAGYRPIFTLTRTGPLDQPLTVQYRLLGTAQSQSDYVRPLVDRLTIPAGERTADLPLDILDDSVGEAPETIRLEIALPSQMRRVDAAGQEYFIYYPGLELGTFAGEPAWRQTNPNYIFGALPAAEVTIQDDDAATPNIVSVSASDTIAFEIPPVESQFTITREGETTTALTVRLEFTGTAANAVDYEQLPFEITFRPGETSRELVVRPFADGQPEPEETVELRLLPGEGYGIERGLATIRLRDEPVYPQTLSIARHPEGGAQLILKGPPNSRLVLESTPDLVTWTPIRTNFLFNTDAVTVSVPQFTNPALFYRTVRALNAAPSAAAQ